MYDKFPSIQKGLVKLKNKDDISLLSKLYDDRSNNIFMKKVSAYKDRDSLLGSIKKAEITISKN